MKKKKVNEPRMPVTQVLYITGISDTKLFADISLLIQVFSTSLTAGANPNFK